MEKRRDPELAYFDDTWEAFITFTTIEVLRGKKRGPLVLIREMINRFTISYDWIIVEMTANLLKYKF